MENFGVKLKSTKTGKWVWHCNKDGEPNKFDKEGAEKRAAMWDEKVAKVAKIPAAKKTAKKVTKKKVTKKKTARRKS